MSCENHLGEQLVGQESCKISSGTPQSFSDGGKAPENVLLVGLVGEKSHASLHYTRTVLLNFAGMQTCSDPLHDAKRRTGDISWKESR